MSRVSGFRASPEDPAVAASNRKFTTGLLCVILGLVIVLAGVIYDTIARTFGSIVSLTPIWLPIWLVVSVIGIALMVLAAWNKTGDEKKVDDHSRFNSWVLNELGLNLTEAELLELYLTEHVTVYEEGVAKLYMLHKDQHDTYYMFMIPSLSVAAAEAVQPPVETPKVATEQAPLPEERIEVILNTPTQPIPITIVEPETETQVVEEEAEPVTEAVPEVVDEQVSVESVTPEVDYSTLPVAELKILAKEKAVKGYYKMRKDELITALNSIN